MRAIQTKWLGPTEHKGSRITAWDSEGFRVTLSLEQIPHDRSGHDEEAHRFVAEALRDKMKWTGRLIGGGIKGGMVWVFDDKERNGR